MARLTPERLALLRGTLARKGLGTPHAAAIPRRSERGGALSAAQERLYFLEAYEPGTPLYNDCVALHVDGPLDAPRFAAALAAVQARHELLRTSFELEGDGPRQRVHEGCALPLRTLDLCAEPARADGLVAEEARAPFELERAPAWRALLLRTGDERWLFACTMHHIVSDGASYGLLFRELEEHYAALGEGRDARVPELPVQFGDYAAWERAALDETRAATDLEYWKSAFPGELAALELGPGRATRAGAQAHVRMPADLAARVEACARAQRATANQVLLTTWLAQLALLGRADDVRTGTAMSLRRRSELEPLLGFFVQTLALHVAAGDDPDFATLLARTRAAALGAAQHAELPFDRVARALERRGGTPLLESFFSHMQDAIAAPRLGCASTRWEFVDPGVARFPLSLVLHGSAAGVQGFLEHDLGLVPAERARLLVQDYQRLLAAVLERPGVRLSELRSLCSALAPTARKRLLDFPARPRRAMGG